MQLRMCKANGRCSLPLGMHCTPLWHALHCRAAAQSVYFRSFSPPRQCSLCSVSAAETINERRQPTLQDKQTSCIDVNTQHLVTASSRGRAEPTRSRILLQRTHIVCCVVSITLQCHGAAAAQAVPCS